MNRHTYSTGHTYYGTQCRMKQEEGQGAGSAKEKIKLKLVKADTLPTISHLAIHGKSGRIAGG